MTRTLGDSAFLKRTLFWVWLWKLTKTTTLENWVKKTWWKLGSKFGWSRLPPGASISELFGIGTLGYLSREMSGLRSLLPFVGWTGGPAWLVGKKLFKAAKNFTPKQRDFSLHGKNSPQIPRKSLSPHLLIGTILLISFLLTYWLKSPNYGFGKPHVGGPTTQFLSSRPVYGELSLYKFPFGHLVFGSVFSWTSKSHTWQKKYRESLSFGMTRRLGFFEWEKVFK